MKEFVKMTLATIAGLFLFGFVAFFLFFAMVGAIASIGSSQPVMPREGVLQINMSAMTLTEQTQEEDPFASLAGSGSVTPVGIYSAIKAVNAAATDPAVKFIYMKPDGASGGIAQIEEFRKALENFRNSGKAIVSYIENPSNASYYLASVSDKIYMTSYEGGMNMFSGLSSQMIFLKDILDRLGVNVQLIRHGKYKSAGEMYIRNSASPENMEQNTEMVESVWNSWAVEIAQSRDISVEDLNAMLDNLDEDDRRRVVYRSNNSAHANGGVADASTNSDSAHVSASIGSRLAFKTRELAIYAGRQFIEVYAPFCLNSEFRLLSRHDATDGDL